MIIWPILEQDEAVHTLRGAIGVATVIVAVHFAQAPKKGRPKLSACAIRERDGNCCQ